MNPLIMSNEELVKWYDGKTDVETLLLDRLRERLVNDINDTQLLQQIAKLADKVDDDIERFVEVDEELQDCIYLLENSKSKDLKETVQDVIKLLKEIKSKNQFFI